MGGLDKVRDKIFDLVGDHNEAFAIYKSSIKDGSMSSEKIGRKKMDSAFKKLTKILQKMPRNYRYKDEIDEMYRTLKRDRAEFE